MPFVTEGTMRATTIGRNDDWGTPQALFDALDGEFRFDVDVCAHEGNRKCETYWTLEDDGLAQDWTGKRCFMNPPYGRTIGAWVRKAADSASEGGGTVVVGLLPCRTDAKWWGDVMRASEIRLIRGRLRYSDGPQAAPFPSCIVVWGTPRVPVIRWVDPGEVRCPQAIMSARRGRACPTQRIPDALGASG